MKDFTGWLTNKKAIVLIFSIGFFVYFNSLGNGFVWDDEEQIVNNAIIQNLANFPYIFSGGTFSTGGAGLLGWFFRPFLTAQYMVLYAFFGQNSWGFHLYQVLIHITNAIFLFILLERLVKNENQYIKTLILAVSLLFVIHPAISEGVIYIAALSEPAYTLFGLLSLLIISNPHSKFSLTHVFFVGFFLLIAAFNKESAMVFFPLLSAYLLIYKPTDTKKWLITLSITALLYFFIRLVLVGTPIRHPEYAPISEAPLLYRLLTVPSELTHYLLIMIFPQNLAISQHWVVTNTYSQQFLLPMLVIVCLILTTCYLILKFKSKLFLFGLIWFVLGFGIISNVFPLDMTVAERWLYFPFIGICMMLAGLLSELKNRYLLIVAGFLLFVVVPLLSIRTMVRNTNWVDGLTLYSHDSKISQNSFDLENNLGVELFRSGDIKGAKEHFLKSIRLQPQWFYAQNNLGAIYEKEGDYPAAKKQYEMVLQGSDYYLAYENLAQLLLFHESTESAKLQAEESLKKLPNNPNLWLTLAIALYQLGEKDKALEASQNAYYLRPSQQSEYVYSRIKQGLPLNINN